MSSEESNNISINNKLSLKILPQTLLKRLVSKEKDKINVEVCENSWRENIRGACGLFDISGFSRLAAKLSNDEKNNTLYKEERGIM